MERQTEAFNDAGNGYLQQQYSQGYNAPDNLFSHSNDSLDASWGVNASSPYPQSSRAVYQTGDWPGQQHHLNVTQQQSDRRSPLASNTVYQGANYNGYNSYGYQPQQQYDPSLLQTAQAFKQPQQSAYASQTTIAPYSLQQTVQPEPENFVDEAALANAIPASTPYNIFSMIDMTQLMKATNTQKLAAYATIAKTPVDYNISRAAVPQYVARQSRNALKRMAGHDGELLAKINHRDAKRQRSAAKRSAGGVRMMKTAGDVAGSARGHDSDDESDDSDTDDEAPLPAKRPDSATGGIEYDTVQALWRSKRTAIDAADVRKGLVDFWEVIKTIRDRWKLDAAAVTEAKEKGPKSQITLLEQRVKDQRDMIETAFKAALKYGNRTIVETLSENVPLLFLCYQFLLDRIKDDDYNGSLSRAILELMSIFNSISEDKLEKTHLVKVMPRYIKNGDAKTQFWSKQIISKAKQKPTTKATAPKADGVKAVVKTDVTAVAKKPVTAAPTPASSIVNKRPLELDETRPVVKKAATSNGAIAKPAEPAKPKAPTVSKLTNGLFAGLQSAAKKPGTSVKTTSTPATNTAVKPALVSSKPVASVAPVAVNKPAFSFTSAMQDLARPKEEKPAPKVVEKDVSNETPQQKAKRLRREARGVLRVRWKSAEELEQVRVFVHDIDEETGHDSSQTRDVGDLQGEGRMFKQQHNKMDIDEDEEEVEVKLIDWYSPAEIDFSDVPQSEQARNFYPYGGGKTMPDSAENAIRKKYEDNTLMVFYSHSDDIPATPREPEEELSGEKGDRVTFGDVQEKFLDRAARLRASRQPPKPIDFNALRNALGNPAQAAPPPAVMPDLGAILAQFAQKPAQAPAAPVPGFNAGAPQFANLFPQAAPPAAPVNAVPNIAAIIAQLNGGVAPQQAPTPAPAPAHVAPPFVMPPMPGVLDPGFAAFLAQRGMQPQLPAPPVPAPATAGMFENPDRKRMRDESVEPEGRKEHPNYKTRVCKYWLDGTCTRGDDCTFRHEKA